MRAASLAGAAVAALLAVGPVRAQSAPDLGPTDRAGPTDRGGTGGNGAPLPAAIPATMPPDLPTMSPAPRLASRERRAVRAADRWRLRGCGTSLSADGVLEVMHGACEPTLVCAPFRWCDVALEPGEGPTDLPDIGDTRWQYQLRWAVEGMKRTMHIRFRPTDAGLDSNFVFSTNQRTVSLRLVSQPRAYMAFLKLSNPNAAARRGWALAAAQATVPAASATRGCDAVPVVPPSAFSIDAPRRAAGWAPVQVYGVASPGGTRTCIDFPADIGGVDLPTLVVRDASGVHHLVNSRLVGRRMEVDALVNAADLVAGVGSDRVVVSIARKDFR